MTSTAAPTVRALEGFVVGTADGRRRIAAGEIFASDDPIVVHRAHLFGAVDEPTVVRQPAARPGSKSRKPAATARKAAKARKATKRA